jgi:integrase
VTDVSLAPSAQESPELVRCGHYEDEDCPHCDSSGFRPLLQQAVLPQIGSHDLQHTFATLLLSNAGHPKMVQEMLSHFTITQSMGTYSHVRPDMQDEAVSVMEGALS